MTKTDPRPARERRSLLITEPNGSAPVTPVKNEASPLNSSTDAQPTVSSAKNTLQTNKAHDAHDTQSESVAIEKAAGNHSGASPLH